MPTTPVTPTTPAMPTTPMTIPTTTTDKTSSLIEMQAQQLAFQYLVSRRPKQFFKKGGKLDFERYLREFEMAIATPGLSPELKLYEMKFWWVGTPGILVSRYLLREDHEIALKEAIAELKAKFGKRRTSAEEMLEDLLSGGKIPSKDIEAVDEFVEKIQTVYQTAIETDRDKDFDKRSIYESILKVKLPHFRYKWLQKWAKNEEDGGSPLSFSDFISYLNLSRRMSETINRFDNDKTDRAEAKSTSGRDDNGNGNNFFFPPKQAARARSFQPHMKYDSSVKNEMKNNSNVLEMKDTSNVKRNDSNDDVEASSQTYCVLCEQPHALHECQSFLSLNPDERSTACRNKNMCFKCLQVGHRAAFCSKRLPCLECGGPHHKLLHGTSAPSFPNKNATTFEPNRSTFRVDPKPAASTASSAPTAPRDTA